MEKYTYEIRPNKPFNFMDKTIKTNCSLQLSIPEALTIIESNKARVYRIFPDINNSVKVDKNNIHELHRKYFNSKPIINRANSITEKALDKSEDKVISSNDAFIETRENEKKEIVDKSEEEIEDTGDTTQQDAEEVPEENKEEMLDKMENEEDVDSAVEIIANRIANAEEEFVKKNAEDKEKIEQIVQNVNDRIEAVKSDVTTDDETKAEEEEDLQQEATRMIKDIELKPSMTLFERMVRESVTDILKDDDLKAMYTNYENGKIDLGRVVGNVACIYGFLEFCNTTQIKKIDEQYIRDRFIN